MPPKELWEAYSNHTVCPSVHTLEWTLHSFLVGYFKFIVFRSLLLNKPHLHINGANKLKMRFIP